MRIQSLAGFFRLQDASYRATGHAAQKVRVTGYLLWEDQHNGSAEVGWTIQRFGRNGLHQPWRSTAWEIHPVMKVEVIHKASYTTPPTTAADNGSLFAVIVSNAAGSVTSNNATLTVH